MKIDNVSFPYPVLGIGDDILPFPSLSYSLSSDKINYYISIDFKMQNNCIAEYIKNGYAKFLCEVECPTTYYRKGISSSEPHMEIVISRNEIARTVTFQCTVTVLKDIPNYVNEGFHEDYAGMSFSLTPGDLMAYFGDFSLEADIEYDKLRSLDSMMSISKRTDIKEPYFNLHKDKIDIQLPEKMYEQYVGFGKKPLYASFIHTSLVLNALTYALYNIDADDLQSRLWVRTIKLRLENEEELKNLGINPFETNEDIPKLAQAMLKNPYERMFKGLENINSLLEED